MKDEKGTPWFSNKAFNTAVEATSPIPPKDGPKGPRRPFQPRNTPKEDGSPNNDGPRQGGRHDQRNGWRGNSRGQKGDWKGNKEQSGEKPNTFAVRKRENQRMIADTRKMNDPSDARGGKRNNEAAVVEDAVPRKKRFNGKKK